MFLKLTYQPNFKPPKDRSKENLRKKEARREIRLWLKKYKEERGCSNCSEMRVATLDFHHLDQSAKTIEINEAIRMRWSKTSIEKEIEKCVLICANCHRCEHENSGRTPRGVYVFSDDELYSNFVCCATGTRS